jgi:hypothetical protein
MEFAFDERKSKTTKAKHGIDFVEAQTLWQDVSRVEVPARTKDEPRLMAIGKIGQKHWTIVFTHRGSKTRIISARRSRIEEVRMYES